MNLLCVCVLLLVMSIVECKSQPMEINESTEETTEPVSLLQKTTTLSPRNAAIARIQQEISHFHDIYMRFASPFDVMVAHRESKPQYAEQRWQSLNPTKRNEGEVMWHDGKTGGYGLQRWNLTLGYL